MNLEVAGQRHHGGGDAAQAEGAPTAFTVKMSMHIVEVLTILSAVTVGATHGILERACAVVDSMNEVMSEKQGNTAVDGGFIYCVELVLQTLK